MSHMCMYASTCVCDIFASIHIIIRKSAYVYSDHNVDTIHILHIIIIYIYTELLYIELYILDSFSERVDVQIILLKTKSVWV